MPDEKVKIIDLKDEEQRTYWFGYPLREVRISSPNHLEYREGGSTHRIFSSEQFVHVVPAPGYFGCYVVVRLRQKFQPILRAPAKDDVSERSEGAK